MFFDKNDMILQKTFINFYFFLADIYYNKTYRG